MGIKIHSYKNGDSYDFSPIPAPEKGPISDAELPEKLAKLEAAVESGGGGEVKFYPEVIMVGRPEMTMGGTLTPTKGEQITLEKSIDVGTYAIIQSYYEKEYGKRVLGKCISKEVNDIVKNIKQAGYNRSSEPPTIGLLSSFYNDEGWAEIGDIIAVNYVYYSGEPDFGWYLAKVTDVQGTNYSYEIIDTLPDTYNGETGTVTISQGVCTIEVIATIDALDNTPYNRYYHRLVYDTMTTDETTGEELGTKIVVTLFSKSSEEIRYRYQLRQYTAHIISGSIFKKSKVDETGEIETLKLVGYMDVSFWNAGPTPMVQFDFIDGDYNFVCESDEFLTGFTDTVTQL